MADVKEQPPPPSDQALLDLDAFGANASRYRVKVDGREYAVRRLADLTGQEELDLAALDRMVREAKTVADVRRALFDQAFTMVRLLVPDLPEKVRLSLRYEQADALAAQAWSWATAAASANPQKADTDTGAVPGESSKPASADSSASTRAA